MNELMNELINHEAVCIRIIDSNANTVGTYFVVNKGHSATSLKVKIQENFFPDSWLDFALLYNHK